MPTTPRTPGCDAGIPFAATIILYVGASILVTALFLGISALVRALLERHGVLNRCCTVRADNPTSFDAISSIVMTGMIVVLELGGAVLTTLNYTYFTRPAVDAMIEVWQAHAYPNGDAVPCIAYDGTFPNNDAAVAIAGRTCVDDEICSAFARSSAITFSSVGDLTSECACRSCDRAIATIQMLYRFRTLGAVDVAVNWSEVGIIALLGLISAARVGTCWCAKNRRVAQLFAKVGGVGVRDVGDSREHDVRKPRAAVWVCSFAAIPFFVAMQALDVVVEIGVLYYATELQSGVNSLAAYSDAACFSGREAIMGINDATGAVATVVVLAGVEIALSTVTGLLDAFDVSVMRQFCPCEREDDGTVGQGGTASAPPAVAVVRGVTRTNSEVEMITNPAARLPEGWTSFQDEDGGKLYVHRDSNTMTPVRPVADASRAERPELTRTAVC